jgi:hypothetical protein
VKENKIKLTNNNSWLLISSRLLWMQPKNSFDINKFLWWCPFLHGDSCETGCQQKQIWQLEISTLLKLSFVCSNVVVLNQINTYSSRVVFLVPFGRQFGCSFVFRQSTLKIYQTIFFSLLMRQATFEHDVFFCHSIIWLFCVWIWWNKRNLRLFRNSEMSISQLLDKIKHSYPWLKSTHYNFLSNYHK